MLGNRPMSEWVAQYATSHRHPVNRLCHTLGIPLIVISILMAAAGFFVGGLWWPALAVFIIGWVLQFIGHYIEGEPPEFFKDWRFLFVGLRWWLAKISGKPDTVRVGAAVRGEVSLVARSPLAGQISLGGTGRWNRYRALPGPPFDLSATTLRRLGRTLATSDTSPRSAPALPRRGGFSRNSTHRDRGRPPY